AFVVSLPDKRTSSPSTILLARSALDPNAMQLKRRGNSASVSTVKIVFGVPCSFVRATAFPSAKAFIVRTFILHPILVGYQAGDRQGLPALAAAGLHAGHHAGQLAWQLPGQFAPTHEKIIPSWRPDARAQPSSCRLLACGVAIPWSQVHTLGSGPGSGDRATSTLLTAWQPNRGMRDKTGLYVAVDTSCRVHGEVVGQSSKMVARKRLTAVVFKVMCGNASWLCGKLPGKITNTMAVPQREVTTAPITG